MVPRRRLGLALITAIWVIASGLTLAQPPAGLTADQERRAPTESPGSTERRRTRTEGPRRDADLALVGVIVREEGVPLAIIEDRQSKRQGVYKVGALVRGARVTRILEDRVVLTFADEEVELRLAGATGDGPPAPPPIAAAVPEPAVGAPVSPPSHQPGVPHLERATLDRLLGMPDAIMDATPLEEGVGVKVTQVRRSTLFEVLGLRKGDVIRSVNGRFPGASVTVPQAIQQGLETGMIRLEVERDGKHDVRYIQIER